MVFSNQDLSTRYEEDIHVRLHLLQRRRSVLSQCQWLLIVCIWIKPQVQKHCPPETLQGEISSSSPPLLLRKLVWSDPSGKACLPQADSTSIQMVYTPVFASTREAEGFPGGSDSKVSACNAGDLGSIPELGRSPGEGNGYPLQYSCLENSLDRGAWWAIVHGLQRVGHNWGTNNTQRIVSKKEGQNMKLFCWCKVRVGYTKGCSGAGCFSPLPPP